MTQKLQIKEAARSVLELVIRCFTSPPDLPQKEQCNSDFSMSASIVDGRTRGLGYNALSKKDLTQPLN